MKLFPLPRIADEQSPIGIEVIGRPRRSQTGRDAISGRVRRSSICHIGSIVRGRLSLFHLAFFALGFNASHA
jgi:hypothetical protein